MFKLKLKKYLYTLLKYIIRAKMEVYEVIIMDIDAELNKIKTLKILDKMEGK